ncbi:VOC family protein [Fimbriiglobus ruber]|uniref:Glyoxalase family protein n=1 Tax=Fimbriiglobus ruber TaxID=1908690 RepID=A0A225CYG5_9BACT|nr:VOC family protein [Fimbriiglobus ruber]OWK34420.1 Glyoxalase family protein [Fimbriiglobus ruber]
MSTALIPHLVVHDGVAAIEFYKAALGAVEVFRMPAQDGKRLMHASLTIGGSPLFLNDDFPEYCEGKAKAPKHTGSTAVTLHINVPDCDAAIVKMADAGATVTMPAADMFWGDRYGRVQDPFGHEWSFSTTLSPERAQAAKEAFAKQGIC